MIVYNNIADILVISYAYLSIYNFTLLFFFWTLQQFINFSFKTIYSFNDFRYDTFYTSVITICLFSMAGVPPFLGFFAKLALLLNLTNSELFYFYLFFFILLFFGLYFYLQNLRFLYSTSQKFQNKINYAYELNFRQNISFAYGAVSLMFFLSFGFLILDDLTLYFNWLHV